MQLDFEVTDLQVRDGGDIGPGVPATAGRVAALPLTPRPGAGTALSFIRGVATVRPPQPEKAR